MVENDRGNLEPGSMSIVLEYYNGNTDVRLPHLPCSNTLRILMASKNAFVPCALVPHVRG